MWRTQMLGTLRRTWRKTLFRCRNTKRPGYQCQGTTQHWQSCGHVPPGCPLLSQSDVNQTRAARIYGSPDADAALGAGAGVGTVSPKIG